MDNVVLKGVEIVFYSSPEDLPMKRYQRFNKYLMIDNEVGSDFADFNTRLNKVVQFFKKGMNTAGSKELENWRQMVYNSFKEYSPKGMALACLVKSIGGVECKSITGDALQKVVDRLDELGFSERKTDQVTKTVKKKLIPKLVCIIRKKFLKILNYINITTNSNNS
jgi:hypothetical protein